MKAVAIILSILIFTACLIIGIQAGSSTLPPLSQALTPTFSQAASAPGQRTYVIVGVDDLSAESPRLVSTWVLFFRPAVPHISALVLYPQGLASPGSGTPDLPATFALQEDRTVVEKFSGALQEYHFSWDGIVVIDKTGTRILIDWLGGVEFNGSYMDGSSAVSAISDPWSDQVAALHDQDNLGHALCSAASKTGGKIDWQGLNAALFPAHAVTNVDLGILQSEFSGLLALDQALSCDFPESLE